MTVGEENEKKGKIMEVEVEKRKRGGVKCRRSKKEVE